MMGLLGQVLPTVSDPCDTASVLVSALSFFVARSQPRRSRNTCMSTNLHTGQIPFRPCDGIDHLRAGGSGFRSCQVAHELSFISEPQPSGIYTFHREVDRG